MNPKSNKIALITGASSGIGKAFAMKLAADGYDLILVSRNREMLEKISNELNGLYETNSEIIVADLSTEIGIEKVETVISNTAGLHFLINNAGFGLGKAFYECDMNRIMDILNVHIVSTTRFCRAVLPKMIERNEGAIINVSSMAAYLTTSATYSPTKSYLNSFSLSLKNELSGIAPGIKVQALCPGFTRTGFHSTKDMKNQDFSNFPDWFWMNADSVVEQSLNALEKKSGIFIPGWRNRFVVWLLTGRVISRLVRRIMEKRHPENRN